MRSLPLHGLNFRKTTLSCRFVYLVDQRQARFLRVNDPWETARLAELRSQVTTLVPPYVEHGLRTVYPNSRRLKFATLPELPPSGPPPLLDADSSANTRNNVSPAAMALPVAPPVNLLPDKPLLPAPAALSVAEPVPTTPPSVQPSAEPDLAHEPPLHATTFKSAGRKRSKKALSSPTKKLVTDLPPSEVIAPLDTIPVPQQPEIFLKPASVNSAQPAQPEGSPTKKRDNPEVEIIGVTIPEHLAK